MPTKVIMPKFGMSQEIATVIEWLKAEGDTVKKGEPIMNVETDKVTMEVEAPASGVLAGIRVQADDVVPVTETIAWILQPGEALPAETKETGPTRPEVATEAPATTKEIATTPVARRMAEATGLDLHEIAGKTAGRITRTDVETHLKQKETANGADKIRATPAARRLAREHEVALSDITGSGPRGRIQAADVTDFVTTRPEPGDRAVGGQVQLDTAEIIPLRGMRRTIARRLQQSAQEAPHVMFTLDIDMGSAQMMVEQLQMLAGPDLKVSMTALLVKAVGWNLLRHRSLNAHLIGEEVHLMPNAHVGLAVALENGLIVPVVRRVETKGVLTLAAEINDLAKRAREGKLSHDEVSGGTFTISNLGMFGLDHFTAIINPPEVGILAVGRIAKRVVVPEGRDEPAVRPLMTVTLSADHRVIDGAVAARFLADLKRVLENPALLIA